MMRLVIVILIFVGNVLAAYGQSVQELLDRYLQRVRQNPTEQVPNVLLREDLAAELLAAAPAFYTDTIAAVRGKVYFIISKLGQGSSTSATREKAVSLLTAAITDSNAGNAGAVLNSLSFFPKQDFTAAAKDTIAKRIDQKIYHYDMLLKLAGYLVLESKAEIIRSYAFYNNSNTRDRWAALLALSRMGDTEATQSILARVQRLKLNDDVVYEVFPDLVYTRQPAAIEYMVTVLNSDEKNCLSPNPDSEVPIVCGYRVMEQLAPIIDGYPLKLGPSGDIEATDYVKALEQVRKWFKTKGTNYTIRKDTF